MGSIRPSGGTAVERFKVCDEDGNLCVVIQYELTQKSREVRRDGMSERGSITTYYELEDGRRVVRAEDEPEAFQIVGSDKRVWKLGHRK
jgi:hypothetical protein